MRLILALGLMIGLSPIAVAQPVEAPPPVRFAETMVYKADATSLEIVIQDQTPREYPQVGHTAPTTYEQALRNWAAQRFQLTGNSINKLRITLKEGRITEKVLPIQTGIRGWFKKEESVQYDSVLSLEIAIVDPNGSILSKAESSSMVTRTLLEGVTRAKKEAAWIDMINTAFDNADRELKARLREYMSRYIS